MATHDPAASDRSRRRIFFVWFLPSAWATISLIATRYSGDEHGLWLVGSLPGAWIAGVAASGIGTLALMLLAVAAGSPIVALFGWAMDRARVKPFVWFPAWMLLAACICVATLRSYPSYSRAISKNGSFLAYCLASLNLSLMVTSVYLFLGFGYGTLMRSRTGPRPGHCASCGYNLTGNVSGRCPECGKPTAAVPPTL